jgi:hypothetical protein
LPSLQVLKQTVDQLRYRQASIHPSPVGAWPVGHMLASNNRSVGIRRIASSR